MTALDSFYNLIYYNSYEYCLSVLISLPLFYFVYKRVSFSVLDPIAQIILAQCITFATAVFYKWVGTSNPATDSFLIMIFMFNVGLLLFGSGYKSKLLVVIKNNNINLKLVNILMIVCVFLFALNLSFNGTPLFSVNKLEGYEFSGGSGVLLRLSSQIILMFAAVCGMSLVSIPKRRMYLASMLILSAVMATFSGSKSSIISVFICAVLGVLYQASPIQRAYLLVLMNRILIILLPLMLASVAFVMEIGNEYSDSEDGIVWHLFNRLIMYADPLLYANAENTSVVEFFEDVSLPIYLLSDFLGLVRLYDWSELPMNVGVYLYQSDTGLSNIKGPNTTFALVGYVFLGSFGILYSFVIGCLIGSLRKIVLISNDGVLYSVLTFIAGTAAIDFSIFVTYLTNFFFAYVFVYKPISLLANVKQKSKHCHSCI